MNLLTRILTALHLRKPSKLPPVAQHVKETTGSADEWHRRARLEPESEKS